MADLKTNYKDDVLDTSVNEKRKFNMIQNSDGTVSFEDVTEYTQTGDSFGAADINATNAAVNKANSNLSELLNRNFVYSTSEKIVGTWIDGKTIYSKTFSIVNPSNNQIIESDITKKMIKIEAFAVGNNGYTFVIPYTSMNTDIYATANGLLFRTNDTWNGFTLYVTYYYTKN